jgi:N utilization substance protein B
MTRVRSGRHPARRLALQTLFESDFHGPQVDSKATWERGVHRAGLSERAAAFAWELVDGVMAHRGELDSEIERFAPEWPVAQLAPIDRNILRIALFELRHQPDTPAAAVIDEAVELAKDFGSEASPKFVNGVLASAVRDA